MSVELDEILTTRSSLSLRMRSNVLHEYESSKMLTTYVELCSKHMLHNTSATAELLLTYVMLDDWKGWGWLVKDWHNDVVGVAAIQRK